MKKTSRDLRAFSWGKIGRIEMICVKNYILQLWAATRQILVQSIPSIPCYIDQNKCFLFHRNEEIDMNEEI